MDSQAISTVLAASGDRQTKPTASELVQALLEAEKQVRNDKPHYQFANLPGSWDLRFITGTKVALHSSRGFFGAGWYVPRWVKLRIILSQRERSEDLTLELEAGKIENQVNLGAITLTLSGLCKFWGEKRLLAFDFTRARVQFLGMNVYDGFIGNGESKEKTFDRESFNKLAFFAYFVMSEQAIAARGRGGGIAIWSRVR